MDKKMISPHIEWCVGKCPGLCIIFFITSTWYLKFMLYYTVIYIFGGILRFFPYVCPQFLQMRLSLALACFVFIGIAHGEHIPSQYYSKGPATKKDPPYVPEKDYESRM